MTSSALGRGGKSAAAATPRLSFVLAALVASLPWASPPAAAQTTRTVFNANELDNAWRSAQPGDTIELRPGTYNLVFPVILRQPGLTLRGSTALAWRHFRASYRGRRCPYLSNRSGFCDRAGRTRRRPSKRSSGRTHRTYHLFYQVPQMSV